LSAVANLQSAVRFLRNDTVQLVISERNLRIGGWKDLLAAIQDLPYAPSLVVMSRLADEHLWSEVLNLGGHDVLAKPLREAEVLWVFRHVFEKSSRREPPAAAGQQARSGTLTRAAGQ